MQLDERFVSTASLIKLSHDPGDPVLCSHCPFCGSGQITGRSDGGIDCAFCGQSFIVRVQPAFPGMPQAPGMGAPTDVGPDMGAMPPGMEGEEGMPPGGEGMPPPGMEGEDEGAPPFGEEAEEEEGPPGEEEEGEEEGEEAPPPFKKKSSLTYRTIAGDELPEDAYVRHLAILVSGRHPAVLARIRREAAGEWTFVGDGPEPADYHPGPQPGKKVSRFHSRTRLTDGNHVFAWHDSLPAARKGTSSIAAKYKSHVDVYERAAG